MSDFRWQDPDEDRGRIVTRPQLAEITEEDYENPPEGSVALFECRDKDDDLAAAVWLDAGQADGAIRALWSGLPDELRRSLAQVLEGMR